MLQIDFAGVFSKSCLLPFLVLFCGRNNILTQFHYPEFKEKKVKVRKTVALIMRRLSGCYYLFIYAFDVK